MTDEINKEWLIRALREATEEVCSTMLGVRPEPEEPYDDGETGPHVDGVVSLIGLAGNWVGAGSLCCNSRTACDLSSRLLMSESAAVDEEVLDAIGELTNMIIGNFKNGIEERLGPMGLSIPAVISGHDFRARSMSGKQWLVAPFRVAGNRLEVRVCLARQARPESGTRPTGESPAELRTQPA